MPISKVTSEIEATVSFSTHKDDYGVPGSSVWDAISEDSMEVLSINMFGDDWSRAELIECFGKQGVDALERLIFNNVGEDWDYD